jgi:MFS family permease
MGETKMADGSQSPPAIRTGRHISLGELLRILVGTAAVVAVAAYVDRLHADWPVDTAYVAGTTFATLTLCSALAGYLACRCFFGRFTGLLGGIMFAGIACCFMYPHKGYEFPEFIRLGMLVACSLFIAVGWIDRGRKRDNKPHARSDPSPAASTAGPPVE